MAQIKVIELPVYGIRIRIGKNGGGTVTSDLSNTGKPRDALDAYSDELSNHGCNDYELDNTQENWDMVERMHAWDEKSTVEEWRKSADAKKRPKPKDKIVVMDWFLAAYLAACVRGEA